MKNLLAAIQTGQIWLNRFTKREYARAFREYNEKFALICRDCILSRGDAGQEDLAEELLDGLEEGWKKQRVWNRAAARVNERQMLIEYFSPMLLAQDEPLCGQFAQLLQKHWESRWPKDAYQIAPYEKLQNGFRNSIMGIDLANKHIDPDLDK